MATFTVYEVFQQKAGLSNTDHDVQDVYLKLCNF